jgi:hypothetical protein
MCVAKGWPFVIVVHNNFDYWPSDELAARYRKALSSARRYFFVSEANRALSEKQLGHAFENAETVRNPVLVEKDGVTGFLAEAPVAESFGRALERMWA